MFLVPDMATCIISQIVLVNKRTIINKEDGKGVIEQNTGYKLHVSRERARSY